MLVATLSAEWGFYRTPAGKAVYFTLAFEPDLAEGGGRGPQGSSYVGTVSQPPRRFTVPAEPHLRFPHPRSPRRDGAQG